MWPEMQSDLCSGCDCSEKNINTEVALMIDQLKSNAIKENGIVFQFILFHAPIEAAIVAIVVHTNM